MELLDLAGLAGRANLPVSLTRYYRDRFILFVPAVRVGTTLLHPLEAVSVVQTINQLVSTGSTAPEIEEFLQRVYPVSVITSRDVEPSAGSLGARGAIGALAAMLDERGERIEAELAALRVQLAERSVTPDAPVAAALDATEPVTSALMLAGLEQIHAKLGTLASREQLEWIGDVVSTATHPVQAARADSRQEDLLLRLLDEISKPDPVRTHVSFELQRLNDALERLAEQSCHAGLLVAEREEAAAGRAERDRAAQLALQTELALVRKALQDRDAELTKGFRGLAVAVRTELAELRAAIAELSRDRSAADPGRAGHGGWQPIVVNGQPGPSDVIAEAPAGPAHDARNGRSPRRLGQPIRHAERQARQPVEAPVDEPGA